MAHLTHSDRDYHDFDPDLDAVEDVAEIEHLRDLEAQDAAELNDWLDWLAAQDDDRDPLEDDGSRYSDPRDFRAGYED